MAVVTNLIDILGAETFLRIRETPPRRMRFAQKIFDKGLHPRTGKKGGDIAFWNQ